MVASSVGGAIVPFSTFPLLDAISYGWGNTLIAAVNLSLSLIPILMYFASRRSGEERYLEINLSDEDSGQ